MEDQFHFLSFQIADDKMFKNSEKEDKSAENEGFIERRDDEGPFAVFLPEANFLSDKDDFGKNKGFKDAVAIVVAANDRVHVVLVQNQLAVKIKNTEK